MRRLSLDPPILAANPARGSPPVLPAREHRPFGLTVDSAAAGHDSLVNAIVWWPLAMLLAAAYFTYAYRMFFRTATVRSTSAAIDQPPTG
jgi:cytochrome bd-type quinol oxidase subunit 2